MKWKDSSEMTDKEDMAKEEYFDEEQYSPWEKPTNAAKSGPFKSIPAVFLLLGLAIVTCVAALLILLMSNKGGSVTTDQVVALEGRIRQLEERLDKYEAIDEKVTRIWEQAKSFEKFKDRFDRTEASMSLRMDHLTMSLETLQKQLSKAKPSEAKPSEAKSEEQDKTVPPAEEAPAQKGAAELQYHTVAKGDTFYSISRQYNLSVETLLKINRLEKNSVLQVGQKLIVRNGETEKQ